MFCEVKTRRGSAFGGGYEAVTCAQAARSSGRWRRPSSLVHGAQPARDPLRRRERRGWQRRTLGQPRSRSSRTPSDRRRQRVEHAVDVGLGAQVVHDAGAQVRAVRAGVVALTHASPLTSSARCSPLWYASSDRGVSDRAPAGRWRKHTTDSSGSAARLEVRRLGAARRRGRRRGRRSCSTSRAEPVGAQVLPAHPQLQRAEPARALDRVLVPVQRLVLGAGATR